MLRRLFVRLGPYAASVLVTFAVGVLSVPALIHQVGAGAWAGLAVVQSIAALTTVLVSFGWGATGPNLIAGLATEERRQALMRSAYARIALYALALPIASVIGVAISGLPASVAILATVGYSLQALGVVWFFVGEAKPMRVFLLDAVPRAAGVVFGLVAVWITHSLLAFAASITVAALVSLFLSYRVSLRGAGPAPKPTLSLVWSELVAQRHGVVTTTMASLYYNSALIVVSVISPASLEPFALVFKLYNYAGAALVPVLQFAQGWLPSGGPGLLPRRPTLDKIRFVVNAPALLFHRDDNLLHLFCKAIKDQFYGNDIGFLSSHLLILIFVLLYIAHLSTSFVSLKATLR